jgi:hypothetical protein
MVLQDLAVGICACLRPQVKEFASVIAENSVGNLFDLCVGTIEATINVLQLGTSQQAPDCVQLIQKQGIVHLALVAFESASQSVENAYRKCRIVEGGDIHTLTGLECAIENGAARMKALLNLLFSITSVPGGLGELIGQRVLLSIIGNCAFIAMAEASELCLGANTVVQKGTARRGAKWWGYTARSFKVGELKPDYRPCPLHECWCSTMELVTVMLQSSVYKTSPEGTLSQLMEDQLNVVLSGQHKWCHARTLITNAICERTLTFVGLRETASIGALISEFTCWRQRRASFGRNWGIAELLISCRSLGVGLMMDLINEKKRSNAKTHAVTAQDQEDEIRCRFDSANATNLRNSQLAKLILPRILAKTLIVCFLKWKYYQTEDKGGTFVYVVLYGSTITFVISNLEFGDLYLVKL